MARKKPIDHDFEPVICKKCKQPIETRVVLTARAPLGWHNFSKDGIRSKYVRVEFSHWDDTQLFCGCGVPALPTERPVGRKPKDPQKALEREMKARQRPGKRWTKGLVPKKPHRLTKKNHQLCKKRDRPKRK